MKINENNPYIDGRKKNGGFRHGAGRKSNPNKLKFVNFPAPIGDIGKVKLKHLRASVREFIENKLKDIIV
jgi:hypothetical protein